MIFSECTSLVAVLLLCASCQLGSCALNDSFCDSLNGKTILAFGDSLTKGMYRNPEEEPGVPYLYHAYAERLQALLPDTTVVHSGLPGEEVGHMLGRLKSHLTDMIVKPSVVVILGGTNDVGIGRIRAARISERIIQMHEHLRMLREEDAAVFGGLLHSVIITIPVCIARADHNRAERVRVNSALRDYVARSAREYGGFTWLLDIENLFLTQPCISFGEADTGCTNSSSKFDHNSSPSFASTNMKYWDMRSPLHLSPQGYDELGRIVYERLCLGTEVATH